MALPNVATAVEFGPAGGVSGLNPNNTQSDTSAVSWGAIVAGAAAAAALSLILLILGTGLGLSSVSPWAHSGISATTFGVSTILWVTATQLIASGMGGYLAGRLRTKWVAVHTDEVYFRDTAHGFLAWAVASLVTAALLTSVIGAIISGGIQAGASVAGGVATTATAATAGGAAAAGSEMAKSGSDGGPMGYFVDYLFRKDINTAALAGSGTRLEGAMEQTAAAPSSEVARIFMTTIQTGTLAPEDVKYVGQIVSQRTGLTQKDAEKRVSDTYARMQAKLHDAEAATKDAANKARKASAYAALWIFVSLLGGAFVASLAATYGGRRRDL
ncbi:hypothetical protein [Candidatus Nitrotoga sp. 1052]|uniref:hypothetical protein n=1 Tax=Candidatus Nitrotoga sp. 1052 TaxID=2886964 RepID=UPI001EF67112|nr:hypothetical protein [Candidatus Nitrotoga sp. 1052]CAH1070369.1 conserved membrane hypothetical protein [Candidatus Nitrotoga sp. 1052]